ncbi:MAG: phosphate ABC transporter substrate-binding protein PstS [Bifidobacteriaceae bacterium]|nr:phosphate ABC transporter substrate-binding protein PstS [Bifidobacteriaceae bacterium]
MKKQIFTSALFFIFLAVLTGCSVDNKTNQLIINSNNKNPNYAISGEMAGSGATSQKNSIDAWKIGYGQIYPNISVAYDPKGSGGGRKDIINGAAVFSATDKKLTDLEMIQAKTVCGQKGVIQIPTYISKIAVIFKLDNIASLNLDSQTLVKIFSGVITKWSDPEIVSQNLKLDLPDNNITVVRRTDDSGMTDTFTSFLAKTNSSIWKWGETSSWPTAIASLSQGAQGQAGVANVVGLGNSTIGYVDSGQIGQLGVVNLLDTIEQTSYMAACTHYNDKPTAQFVKSWLEYVVSLDGQILSHNISNSIILNDNARQLANQEIAKITFE